MKKISVIMPSYLEHYEGAAKDRENKFKRAVDSFLNQTYEFKELIIVSDGCYKTVNLYNNYKPIVESKEIKGFSMNKQPLFSGNVRNFGLKKATGELICYLDSDDYIGKNHLKRIVEQFKDNDWVYYNDTVITTEGISIPKLVTLQCGGVGTSSIAHKNIKSNFWGFGGISWKGCNGYGHDWKFVQIMHSNYPNFSKIHGAEYNICHIPNKYDF